MNRDYLDSSMAYSLGLLELVPPNLEISLGAPSSFGEGMGSELS